MTPQTTLDAVREISERALLRPAPTRLRLATPEEQPAGPRRAIMAYEELHLPRIGGEAGRASGQKSRKRKEPARDDAAPPEKDFLKLAAEKAEAAMERRPMVIPAGH